MAYTDMTTELASTDSTFSMKQEVEIGGRHEGGSWRREGEGHPVSWVSQLLWSPEGPLQERQPACSRDFLQ